MNIEMAIRGSINLLRPSRGVEHGGEEAMLGRWTCTIHDAVDTTLVVAGDGRRSSDAFSATLGSEVRIRSVSYVVSSF